LSEAEVERLHAKTGQLLVERYFLAKRPVDERRTHTADDRPGASAAPDRETVRVGFDQPFWVLFGVTPLAAHPFIWETTARSWTSRLLNRYSARRSRPPSDRRRGQSRSSERFFWKHWTEPCSPAGTLIGDRVYASNGFRSRAILGRDRLSNASPTGYSRRLRCGDDALG
jgi:hypothetical protein